MYISGSLLGNQHLHAITISIIFDKQVVWVTTYRWLIIYAIKWMCPVLPVKHCTKYLTHVNMGIIINPFFLWKKKLAKLKREEMPW